MHSFRANRSLRYLALLALALQLALSFGHVHLDERAFGNTRATAAANPSDPGTPSGKTPDADEVCAICAVISLSGALLIPDAPALLFVNAQHEAFFPDLVAVLASDPARAPFHARAPPV